MSKIVKLFFVRSKETFLGLFKYPPRIQNHMDYDEYWKDKRKDKLNKLSDYQVDRISIIQKHLKVNKTVKDIGCGSGAVLKKINEKSKFKKMYGTDISKFSQSFIKKNGITPIQLDLTILEDLDKLPKTDYTLALEILEHLSNSEEVLLKLLDSTKDTLIFSLPNTGFIGHRLRLLFGSFPLQWRLQPGEHLRFWTYRDMKWWLKKLNLSSNSNIILYEGIPILNKVWPSLFAMGQIVIVKLK